METLAATATVVQISIYASNIAYAIQELRQIVLKGTTKLQEQSKRLEVLETVVRKIEQNTRLHSQPVAEYLVTVRDHILRLHGVLLNKLQSPRDTPLRRLSAGFAHLRARKQIEDAFTSLGQDCNYLTLYLSELKSSPSMAHDQPSQVRQLDQQGEGMTENLGEVSVRRPFEFDSVLRSCQLSVVSCQPATRQSNQGTSSASRGAQNQEAAFTAATAFNDIDQSFGNISANGAGTAGQPSSNEVGNVRAAALKKRRLKQVYGTVQAESGGVNRVGNIT